MCLLIAVFVTVWKCMFGITDLNVMPQAVILKKKKSGKSQELFCLSGAYCFIYMANMLFSHTPTSSKGQKQHTNTPIIGVLSLTCFLSKSVSSHLFFASRSMCVHEFLFECLLPSLVLLICIIASFTIAGGR